MPVKEENKTAAQNSKAKEPVAPGLSRKELDQFLQRILASGPFQRATRSGKFLEFVVQHLAEGNCGSISEAKVAKAVFEREDFDARLDPIVRVEAARLRKRLEEYYAREGKGDPMQIRIPRRGYAPELLLNGDVPKGDRAGERDEDPEMLLAVLPVANLSGDESFDSFCDGVTEEVISAITALTDIPVVARTSVSQYDGEPVDLRIVGSNLGVSHLLEGSVRFGKQALRANVNLIDSATGFAAWTASFELPVKGELIVRQAALGGMIAQALADRSEDGAVSPKTRENGESASKSS